MVAAAVTVSFARVPEVATLDLEVSYYMLDDYRLPGRPPLRAFLRVPKEMLPDAKFEAPVSLCMNNVAGRLDLRGTDSTGGACDVILRGSVAGFTDFEKVQQEVFVDVDLGDPVLNRAQQRAVAFETSKTKIVRVSIHYTGKDDYSYHGFSVQAVLDRTPIRYK
jgi:hypothetical protein